MSIFKRKQQSETDFYLMRRLKESETKRRDALYDAEFYKAKMIQWISKTDSAAGIWPTLQQIDSERISGKPQDVRG